MTEPEIAKSSMSANLRPGERDAIAKGLFEYNAENGSPLQWIARWPWPIVDAVCVDRMRGRGAPSHRSEPSIVRPTGRTS
jgi:hypothetical protein